VRPTDQLSEAPAVVITISLESDARIRLEATSRADEERLLCWLHHRHPELARFLDTVREAA
jgi:alkylated DNA repair dioxygenase AlkB